MRLLTRILLGLALAACACAAHAQTYPNKPIRMIVSIAAGSVTDVIMRAAAAELQPRLGQPLVIENVGGAAGILGGKACAQAAGDGYNICVIYHSTMSFNPLLFSNLPYNPDDLVPLARLFFLVEGVFASTELGVNSIAELKTLAQAKPDGAELRDAGRRLLPRPVHEMDEQPVGHPDRRHPLSRRRAGGAGGRRQPGADHAVRRRQFHRRGAGRQGQGAGGLSAKRSAVMPDVPTFAEVGWGDYPGQGWWGLAAPKGTPPALAARLSDEFRSCSASRSSWSSWRSRRWCRPRPIRRASPRSSSRTARTPRS